MPRLLRLISESSPLPRHPPSAASASEETFARIAREYEQLARQLRAYFGGRGCPVDELVAETLFRLVVKAAEGTVIVHLPRYAAGIARHVYADWAGTQRSVDDEIPPLFRSTVSPKAECLLCCLARLDPSDRELLESYYLDPRGDRVRLLTESGISANALRLRIFHVKTRLRECMTRCLAAHRTLGTFCC